MRSSKAVAEISWGNVDIKLHCKEGFINVIKLSAFVKMERDGINTESEEWGGSNGVLDDPAEQKVLYAALDSF